MKTLLVKLSWAALIATVVVALALGAFVVWGLPELVPAGSMIVIDGERFELSSLQPAHAGHWVVVSLGILVAAAVTVVVVPLVVLLSVAVPLLLGTFGLVVALLSLALMMSPVILLVWWLWKKPKPKPITMSS